MGTRVTVLCEIDRFCVQQLTITKQKNPPPVVERPITACALAASEEYGWPQ